MRNGTAGRLITLLVLSQLALSPLLLTAPAGASKPSLTISGAQYFENGAVYPISGPLKETFYFAIKYKDPDGTAPRQGYPRLRIDVNHDGQFDTGDDVNLTMDVMKPDIPSYSLGVNYARAWVFDKNGTYSFSFFVVNEKNETAATGPFYGPVVLPPDHVYADPMTELGLFSLLIFIFSLAFFVIGMGLSHERGRRSWRKRTERK